MERRHQPSEKTIFSRETLMKEKGDQKVSQAKTVSKEFIVYSTSASRKIEFFRFL
jgi:hypothetical protein